MYQNSELKQLEKAIVKFERGKDDETSTMCDDRKRRINTRGENREKR